MDMSPPLVHVNYTLRKVRLNRWGCDASGAYWGHDQPLYYCDFREDGAKTVTTFHLRASDRKAAITRAKAIIEATLDKRVCLWRGNV